MTSGSSAYCNNYQHAHLGNSLRKRLLGTVAVTLLAIIPAKAFTAQSAPIPESFSSDLRSAG